MPGDERLDGRPFAYQFLVALAVERARLYAQIGTAHKRVLTSELRMLDLAALVVWDGDGATGFGCRFYKPTIAARLGVHPDTAKDWMRLAVERGWFVQYQRGGGPNRPALYAARIPSTGKVARPDGMTEGGASPLEPAPLPRDAKGGASQRERTPLARVGEVIEGGPFSGAEEGPFTRERSAQPTNRLNTRGPAQGGGPRCVKPSCRGRVVVIDADSGKCEDCGHEQAIRRRT